MTLSDDGGSYDELARRAGVELRLPRPGELAELEHSIALYWPAVPAAIDARARSGVPVAP